MYIVKLRNEDWKPVTGYPGYSISNYGRVIGKREKLLRHQRRSIRGGRYPFVVLYKTEGGKSVRAQINVHVLVATEFLGEYPKGMVIHHIDHNRNNPHIENLEYITWEENNKLRKPKFWKELCSV